MIEVHSYAAITHTQVLLLFLRRPVTGEDGRHMLQIVLSSKCLMILARDLRCLLHALFIRVTVLLESLDAVLDLRSTETSEQSACLNDADVHDCRV